MNSETKQHFATFRYGKVLASAAVTLASLDGKRGATFAWCLRTRLFRECTTPCPSRCIFLCFRIILATSPNLAFRIAPKRSEGQLQLVSFCRASYRLLSAQICIASSPLSRSLIRNNYLLLMTQWMHLQTPEQVLFTFNSRSTSTMPYVLISHCFVRSNF